MAAVLTAEERAQLEQDIADLKAALVANGAWGDEGVLDALIRRVLEREIRRLEGLLP